MIKSRPPNCCPQSATNSDSGPSSHPARGISARRSHEVHGRRKLMLRHHVLGTAFFSQKYPNTWTARQQLNTSGAVRFRSIKNSSFRSCFSASEPHVTKATLVRKNFSLLYGCRAQIGRSLYELQDEGKHEGSHGYSLHF